MADTNKKEYTSNLHPKGDMDTTVYPNVKSENIIDKDTTAYTAGKVPDSSLVSKSLDGISENLETTKIQVATNKNNIETLQGNYTGLQYQVNTNSSDIALTKTQVETNKTNIAKNTQDIENLSAVMPTDINVDADYHLILEHDGTEITGQKKNLTAHWDFYNYYSNIFKETLSSIVVSKIDGKVRKGNINLGEGSYDSNLKRADANIKLTPTIDGDIPTNSHYGLIKYQYSSDYFMLTNKNGSFSTSFIIPLPSGNSISIRLPNNKSGTLALTSDLATKQSALYRHTVLISEPTNKTAYLAFTAESDKNTPINSIQNLITVFGNTSIACSGIYRDGDPANEQSLLMINVGTSISNTTISSATIANSAITDFSNAPFTDTFGTTGFTITDNVTAM